MHLNIKIISTIIALNIFTFPLMGHSQETKPSSIQKNFQVDLYPQGKIFIQKDPNSTQTSTSDLIILQYEQNGHTQQQTLDNSLPNHSEIIFSFTEKIDKNTYLFVMTKNRKIDHKKKTDGYEYSLHTFVQDSHNKLQLATIANHDDPIIENDNIGSNLYLDGFEGVLNGSKENFQYKTPESIREYLKSSIVHGPLKTDLYPEGKIYFQGKKNIFTYPVSFVLEYNDNGKIKKEVVDQYESNGVMEIKPAEIISVFTHSIQNKPYIFVMVNWNVEYIMSDPRNGTIYNIYAYTKDKNGTLTLDENISDDPQLCGYDGTLIYSNNDDHDKDQFVTIDFNYTTATKIKKYLDQLYNFAMIQGPFPTSLYPEGKIYFQAQESGYKSPINFVLEYNENGQNHKEIIDQYHPDTTTPIIASVFTYSIHQKPYIFTIIKWKKNDFGYSYKIYGYTKDQNNKLTSDPIISNDPKLKGFIGYNSDDGKKLIKFHYETAGKLKKYLKQKYH